MLEEFDIIFNYLEIESILCDIELRALDLISEQRDDVICDIPPRRLLSKRCVRNSVSVCPPHFPQ